jgi:hypothetical protein
MTTKSPDERPRGVDPPSSAITTPAAFSTVEGVGCGAPDSVAVLDDPCNENDEVEQIPLVCRWSKKISKLKVKFV